MNNIYNKFADWVASNDSWLHMSIMLAVCAVINVTITGNVNEIIFPLVLSVAYLVAYKVGK